MKTGKLTEVQRSAIPKMKALGITIQEIAVILDVSEGTVWYHLSPEFRERERIRGRNYRRKHALCVNLDGKQVVLTGLNKRSYPEDGLCELCNRSPKRLEYHHWDGANPSMGLWLCCPCHLFAEAIDSILKGKPTRRAGKYLQLKKHVEGGLNGTR